MNLTTRTAAAALALALAGFLAAQAPAYATPGDLDTSFDIDGKATSWSRA
jgi:hypothetical protein